MSGTTGVFVSIALWANGKNEHSTSTAKGDGSLDSGTTSCHKYAWRYLWGENGGFSKHNLKRHKINFCSLECEWDNPNNLGLISREMRGNERESLEVLGHCFRVAKSTLGLVRAAIYKPKSECHVSTNSEKSRPDRNRSTGSTIGRQVQPKTNRSTGLPNRSTGSP